MVAAASLINEIKAIFATRWGFQRSGEINRARPKEPVSRELEPSQLFILL
jgi:hypothetical protein